MPRSSRLSALLALALLSCQPSAASYQPAAGSAQPSALSPQLAAVADRPPITQDSGLRSQDSAIRAAEETAARLAAALRPGLDPPSLVARLRGLDGGGTIAPPRYTPADVGRVDRFAVLDQTRIPNVQLDIDAELRLVSPNGYWYVQQGRAVDPDALARSAETYEQTVYPTIVRLVGGGRAIGPVSVLHADVPGVSGYFSAADLFSRAVLPQSNERPMLYLNVAVVRPGTAGYAHTLAHELSHLVHFLVNPHEDTWIKEGLGELAQELTDPNYRYGVRSFFNRPGTPLTAWTQPPADLSVHYQAGYLFLQYLLDRYGGGEALAALLAGNGRGPATVDAFLAARGRPERFDAVFRDWLVANLVQDPALAAGQYGYQRPPEGRPRVSEPRAPSREDGRVAQYGADYYQLRGPGGVRVQFQGRPTVPLIGAEPPGGGPFWWANRGDRLDTRLTRSLDLRGVTRATLAFDLRFDTEEAYDYGYVLVSTDGGTRWQPLAGRHTTTANPTGNNLGVSYNGQSGAGSTAEWVREEIDLTPYAGQAIQLRFEYVTDDSYNADGLAVANLTVPELGWQDDGRDWTAEGWVWAENALPQQFAVQVVEYRGDRAVAVRAVPLDAANRADLALPDLGANGASAVLIVAGQTPATLQPARYTLDLIPLAP